MTHRPRLESPHPPSHADSRLHGTTIPPPRDETAHFLARASECLATSLNYEATLVTVAEMALPYLGSWCIVDVVEADGSMRRLRIVHPDPHKQDLARQLEEGWPPTRDDPFGLPRAMQSRATEVIRAVSDDMLIDVASSEQNLRVLRALGIGSVVVVPLIARGGVLGAITFVSADGGHSYSPTDVDMAEDLAARCAIALDNSRLYRDLEAVRRNSVQLNEQLVLASIRQQELAEEAQQANHAKSQFLATMSHEIRTPLNAIVGYTNLLQMQLGGPTTPGQDEYLARIKLSSDHLIELIDDILDLAKVESGRMSLTRETVSARATLLAALTLVEPQAGTAGVTLKTEWPDAKPFCLGDEDRVRQILVILLNNALKFTERGGTVTTYCDTTATPDADARLEGAGPWTFVRVADTGIGISPMNAERVFQPFMQVDSANTRTHSGAGLGLAIGRDLARRMGGDLTLKSIQGVGSCFTLWLPATPAPEALAG